MISEFIEFWVSFEEMFFSQMFFQDFYDKEKMLENIIGELSLYESR